MSIFGKIRDFGAVAAAPFTGGGSLLLGGEDTLARIPVLGGLMGAETDAQKQLLEKQKQMEQEARRQQQRNQQARMQALGQSLLAFNPQNQMMAQMFGPQAAFSPQQMAQMGADPSVAGQPWGTGTNEQRVAQVKDRERRQQIESQTTPLGPGPAPLRLPPPQAARRF